VVYERRGTFVPNDREFKKRLLAGALSERFGLALLEGDAVAAERVVRDAFEDEMPYALIHDAIVAPALHRIGKLWERGEIGVAHEHLATELSLRVLALLRELFGVERRRAEHRVMLAAVEGEHHIVALQMAADLLEDAGYETVMLGPDVPVAALADIVAEHRPAIVAFTLTMSSAALRLPTTVEAIESVSPATAIIVGGRGAQPRLPSPAGLAFSSTVVEVVELADALVRRPELN
jgi:MerR family transcriptional regulator, light-induced transcriptional regulator